MLEEQRAVIESITRDTYLYGTTELHKVCMPLENSKSTYTSFVLRLTVPTQLDVYTPPTTDAASQAKPPILMFFHGGSFTHGGRLWPHRSLIHTNLGAFFAMRGILTVIVDYRLVPSVTYAGGSEDVLEALSWVSRSLKDAGDTDRIFVMGHSAGGVHVAGLLLNPILCVRSPPLRGVIFVGVPYEIPASSKASGHFRAAAEVYYGSAKNVASYQPLGMLRRADKDRISGLPPVRNLIAAREPRYISSAARTFAQLYASKGGRIDTAVLQGHDHTSPIFSLCSGRIEEWGTDVAEWIQNIVAEHKEDPE